MTRLMPVLEFAGARVGGAHPAHRQLPVRRARSALVGVGLVTLFSATDQSVARVTSQVVSLGFALVLMWIVANIPPQTLSRVARAAVRPCACCCWSASRCSASW